MGKSLVSCFLTHGVDYRREKGMSCCSNGSDSPHRRGVTSFLYARRPQRFDAFIARGLFG